MCREGASATHNYMDMGEEEGYIHVYIYQQFYHLFVKNTLHVYDYTCTCTCMYYACTRTCTCIYQGGKVCMKCVDEAALLPLLTCCCY